jgi:hypothetical protein
MEKCPIGVYTGYWGHSFMKAHEVLRRGDPFEDTTGRTHGLMAANHEGASATIRIFHTQDREA